MTLPRLVLLTGCLFAALGNARGADWPMARHDAQRTGATPQTLAPQLHLQWTRDHPKLTKAWPDQPKLLFDRGYEPIVVGHMLYIGSSRTDTVTALDTRTGVEKWTYHLDGPVRFAPAAWEGNLYVACDDGHLYCLAAETGKLLWKFRGGPSDRKLLGNQRLISAWPARGAPVIAEGTVYFAASIWPFMGVFIHALDARTGKVVWTSDGDGSIYIKQPHNTEAFAGVAPQGHLVVAGDCLLVPGGRSVPACYNRHTGKLRYFRLAENGKRGGGSDAAALGDVWFNGGAAFERISGEYLAPFPARCVLGDEVVGFAAGKFTSFPSKQAVLEQTESIDRKGLATKRPKWKTGEARSTTTKLGPVEAMIEAGTRLYVAAGPTVTSGTTGRGEGRLTAFELPLPHNKPAEPAWEAAIDGTPIHLAAADDRLFVTTLEGRVYCFGAEAVEPKVHAHVPTPPVPADDWAEKARHILDTTGVRDGYCIAWGVGSGKLIAELLRQSKLYVVVIDPDAERVQGFRKQMIAADWYGERVSAHVADPLTVLLPPYLASLAVSEEPVLEEALLAKMYASLRPYGGMACFFLPEAKRKGFGTLVTKCELAGAEVKEMADGALLVRAGPLKGAADWTHEHADAGNSRASADRIVKAPLGILWFGGASHDGILPRHGHGPQPQVVDGRVIIEGTDMVRALDIYTGRLLWEAKLPGVGKAYNTLPHQPGANATGGNFVSLSDGIHVIHGTACVRLDPATGEKKDELRLPAPEGKPAPEWTYLNANRDFLVGGTMVSSRPDPTQTPAVALKERLQVWNLNEQAVGYTLAGHTEDVLALAHSPDGKVRASAGDDRIIRLWDTGAEKLLGTLEKCEDSITCLAFSPDGKTLASGGKDRVIRLWNVEERTLLQTLKGHKETLASLAFDTDGKSLASADADAVVKIWILERKAETPQATIDANLEDTTAVALAPNGGFLVAGNSDGTLKIVNLGTRESRTIEGHRSAIQSLVVAPGGKKFAAGYRDRSVRLFDAMAGKVTRTIDPHGGPVTCLAFGPDASTLAVGLEEAAVHVWDVETGEAEAILRTGAGAVRAIAYSAGGKWLITASSEKHYRLGPGYRSGTKQLVVFDRRTSKVLWTREARDSFRNNAISLGGGRLYCIDRISLEELSRLRRRGLEPTSTARILTLDLKTGAEVWSTDAGVFGTWLGYSAKHDILVEAGRKTRDALFDEPKGLRAFEASSGKVLWKDGKPGGPPLLNGDLIIHETGACDLRTGKPKMRIDPVTGESSEWRWLRTYGCNTPLAAENLLTFRSGAAGYCDLAEDSGTGNFGGFRASCTNNLVVAGGLIVAPDYTRNCTCSYQNQTSLALVPMPEVEVWTKYPQSGLRKSVFGGFYNAVPAEDWDKNPPLVKHLALLFGAPGSHRAPNGRLWLHEYVHARVTVATVREGDEERTPAGLGYYNHHTSRIVAANGSFAWVVAGGCRGIARLEVAARADPKHVDGTPYILRLHFADPDHDQPGRRVFDILIDDKVLAAKVDVAKESGGRQRGLVREFKGVKVNGKLTLRFRPAEGPKLTPESAPILSGFEMERMD